MNYFTGNVCKSEWSSLEWISEFFMIKPKLVQNGCLQVIAVCFTAHRCIAYLVRFAMRITFFNASTCHPYGECFGMMVSTLEWINGTVSSFLHWSASEFTGPYYKRFFQQPSLL